METFPWQPWSPQQVAQKLHAATTPWCMVGGWAIDLWLGRQTRPHEDIEISISRSGFPEIKALLKDYRFFVAGEGRTDILTEDEPPADKRQIWVLDKEANTWRLDVMLDAGDAATWIYRRSSKITRQRKDIIQHTEHGIPYQIPEVALLFKAKSVRPKDEADFAACLPYLGKSAVSWLRDALEIAHPGHPWIARLDC